MQWNALKMLVNMFALKRLPLLFCGLLLVSVMTERVQASDEPVLLTVSVETSATDASVTVTYTRQDSPGAAGPELRNKDQLDKRHAGNSPGFRFLNCSHHSV